MDLFVRFKSWFCDYDSSSFFYLLLNLSSKNAFQRGFILKLLFINGTMRPSWVYTPTAHFMKTTLNTSLGLLLGVICIILDK